MESGLLFYKGYGKLRPMTGKKYGYFLYDNSKLQILGLKTNICYEVLNNIGNIGKIGNMKQVPCFESIR